MTYIPVAIQLVFTEQYKKSIFSSNTFMLCPSCFYRRPPFFPPPLLFLCLQFPYLTRDRLCLLESLESWWFYHKSDGNQKKKKRQEDLSYLNHYFSTNSQRIYFTLFMFLYHWELTICIFRFYAQADPHTLFP